MKLGAFLDPHLGALRGSAECGKDRHLGIKPDPIVPPVPRRDHAAVKVQDSLKLGTVE
jgi:hypothetical protein